MKRYISMILSVLLVFSLVGCAAETSNTQNSFAEIYKSKATEHIESGDIQAAIQVLEEGVTKTNDESLKQLLNELKSKTTTASTSSTSASSAETITTTIPTTTTTVPTTTVPPSDTDTEVTEDFNIAKYIGEWATDGFSWQSGGLYLSISLNESKINIACTNVFSDRLVETTLFANTSMMTNGELTSGFEDSWGNRGIIHLKFENEHIVCTVSDMEYSAEGTGVSLGEGEYILHAYAEDEPTSPAVKGDYDSVMGSYVDAYGPGMYYLHIGYQDGTKQNAYLMVDIYNETYEMPLKGSADDEMTGLCMSIGSEPSCAVTMYVTPSGWINADIYIGGTGETHEILFMPIDADEAESENPFYTD